MGLTDREKKIIEEMEAALTAEDPRLVATMERARPSLVINAIAILVGIAALLFGVASKLTIVGIIGFLIVLAGAATIRLKPRAAKEGGKMASRWQQRNQQ